MKRDFVFVWGADVQPAIATLSAPKIAQLRARCDELIARAEHYRQDQPELVRLAETPHLADKNLPWAPFEKFGYWFKLDYRERKRREYVLSLAMPPDAKTPLAHIAQRGPGSAYRRGRARKRRDGSDDFVAQVAANMRAVSAAPCGASWGSLWPRLSDSLRCMRSAGAAFKNFVSVLARNCAARHARLRRTVREALQPAATHGPQARLEPRLMAREAGLNLLIYTLVRDDPPIDWSADLFDPPAEEASRSAT